MMTAAIFAVLVLLIMVDFPIALSMGLTAVISFLTHVTRGFNDKDAGPRLKKIAQTMTKYTDSHFGDCKVGNTMDPGEIMDRLTVGCQVVFKDKESLVACMKELKEIDQGISIVSSGLFDEVFDCC